MVTKKPISWFLTENGRKFSYAFVTGTSIALSTIKYAPQTFFIDKYKDFVHYYSNGKPAALSAELQERCKKCLDILEISESQRKLVSPFSVFGFDLFHAGTFFSKFGVLVGVPTHFKYKTKDDVQSDGILLNRKKVDWESEAGQKLLDSLILPEDVQQFALCREILMTKNNKVIYESIYPFVSVFLSYNLAYYFNQRLNLYTAPTTIRVVLYALVGSFGLGLYFLLQDSTEVSYETMVDKKLCDLGPEYIKSGVVFYDKLLQRNQALRELMGEEGAKKYSVLGNENFFLRQPRVALVHRKMYFEMRLKELTENTGDQNVKQLTVDKYLGLERALMPFVMGMVIAVVIFKKL